MSDELPAARRRNRVLLFAFGGIVSLVVLFFTQGFSMTSRGVGAWAIPPVMFGMAIYYWVRPKA